MLYDWEGSNHRSGVALSVHHRLSDIPTYRLSGLWQGDEHVWTMVRLPLLTLSPLAHAAFDCVYGSGPAYFRDACIPVADIFCRSNFRLTQCGDMVVPQTIQNSARSAELPRCSTSRLECPPCLPPLVIHQSRTIQSWVENPSLQPSLHPLSVFYLLTRTPRNWITFF